MSADTTTPGGGRTSVTICWPDGPNETAIVAEVEKQRAAGCKFAGRIDRVSAFGGCETVLVFLS